MIRLVIGALASLALAPAASTQEFREAFAAVTPSNFDSGGEVSRQFHLHAESYLTMATVAHGAGIRELRKAPSQALAELSVTHPDGESRLSDYVAGDPLLDGVVVLHNGEVIFEAYPNMAAWQRHFAWSVTKVVTATALAALAEDGLVDMQAPVSRYVSALEGTAWAGIAVQHVADMASGIDCLDEDGYQDQTTCIYTMEEALGITAPTGRKLDFIAHLQGMRRHREPGTLNEYVSANTNVLMLVVEAVTAKPFALALQELLWQPIGAEADGLMAISASGYPYASGGLHARLRDVARFGLIYTRPELSGVLAPATVRRIQRAGVPLTAAAVLQLEKLLGRDVPVRAGWQWDLIWADGAMYKGGYSGQGVYVDPARALVVAWFGTGRDFNDKRNAMLPVSRQIARALDKAGV